MTNEQLFLAESVTDYIREAYIREAHWLNGRDIRTLLQFKQIAVCKDSKVGDYSCYVKIEFSPQSGIKPIAVDTCLQHEIWELLRETGVKTIGCCCGHGVQQAYIQVAPESVQKMHELGYEELPEQADGQGKWCFKPKTHLLEPVSRIYKFDNTPTIIPADKEADDVRAT